MNLSCKGNKKNVSFRMISKIFLCVIIENLTQFILLQITKKFHFLLNNPFVTFQRKSNNFVPFSV